MIAILLLLGQAEADTADTNQTQDTTAQDEFSSGGELTEEVVAQGEYRIEDMQMPLVSLPFDVLSAVDASLKQQNAPQQVLDAANSMFSSVRNTDTISAFSAIEELEPKDKHWSHVSGFLGPVADLAFGRYNFAAEDLKQFVDANRGFPLGREARALAVLAHLYAGNYAQGQLLGSEYILEAKEDVKFDFWNGWTYWATGMCSYYKGDYEVAERYFVENISHNKNQDVVLYSRVGAGWCNLHEGRYADAKTQLDMALLSADPESELAKIAQIGKAVATFNLGHYNEAYAMLNDISMPLPRDPAVAAELLYHKGYMADVLRNFDEAERCWRRIVEDYANLPRAADAAFKLGSSYAGAGDNEAATAMLEWLVTQFPNYIRNDRAIYMLAEMYFSQKEFRKALVKFREFLDRYPYNKLAPDVKVRMEQTYYAIALEDESILDEFAENFPNSSDLAEALFYWATKHYEAEEMDTAAALFYKMATLFPKHARAEDALFYAGQIYFNQQKWSYAASTFDKLVSLYPDSKHQREALRLVGISYLKMDRPKKALKLLGELLQTSKDMGEKAVIYHYMGLAYLNLGDTKNAAEMFEAAAVAYSNVGRMEEVEIVNKLKEGLAK